MDHYSQLKDLLNNMFELNKADLDFGIYRIMNQKRKQVNEFVDKQLPEDIKKTLSETQTSDKTEIEKELKDMRKNLEALDIKPEDNPKYKAKLEQLNLIQNTDALEQDVFSHLTNFFKRYYKEGDFISMRRYKKDVYAIPYEGEEVKLYWANHDQYYIKSSENFKNYSFILPNGKKATFQLKEVSTEQNNNKTQGDAERRFAIFADCPVEENGDELFLNFIYEPFPKATKQETLLAQAIETLSAKIPAAFAGLFSLKPTDKNKSRTLLEKHLSDYVARNTFDYFIHKDLGGFLSRELDFYIKNEVLYLDDINARQPDFFAAQLSKIKAMKVVAQKIIDFLAQIENFQKKLWLKKKFVVSTNYCITLDRIPESYYAEIFSNKAQLAEWKTLFDVTIQNQAQLTFEPYLVLDTKFFDEKFKDRLIAEFENFDEQINGLLFNSENYQALGLIQKKYEKTIKTIFIDPPYNTEDDRIKGKFMYKDNFINSSWLSLIYDRLESSYLLLTDNGVLFCTLDDNEAFNFKLVADEVFSQENFKANIIWNSRKSKQNDIDVSLSHNYIVTFSKSKNKQEFLGIPLNENEFSNPDKDPKGKWKISPLDAPGIRERTSYFPIVNPNTNVEFYPPKGRHWTVFEEDVDEYIKSGIIYFGKEGKSKPQWKRYWEDVKKDSKTVGTIWDDSDTATAGSKELENMFNQKDFETPKPVKLLFDLCQQTLNINDIIIDYFAGSGTTAHATIKLNREDGGKRKYILVEMGTYFNTVTKPRIEKVVYSDNWKNGKPQNKKGISQLVKYQVLESFEDTLNNLQLKQVDSQALFEFGDRANEEYLLQYMLEFESRDHLFNIEMFRKPFDYQLNVTENNELKPVKVDLVETFNYLIGLYVNKVQRIKDMKVVEGVTRTGVKTLVIWRDLDTTTHDDVLKLIRRFYDSARTREFDQIYINGDHHLENIRQDGDRFKIKQIEETFFKKMFNENEW